MTLGGGRVALGGRDSTGVSAKIKPSDAIPWRGPDSAAGPVPVPPPKAFITCLQLAWVWGEEHESPGPGRLGTICLTTPLLLLVVGAVFLGLSVGWTVADKPTRAALTMAAGVLLTPIGSVLLAICLEG